MLSDKQDQVLRFLNEAARLEGQFTFTVSVGKRNISTAKLKHTPLSKLPAIGDPRGPLGHE